MRGSRGGKRTTHDSRGGGLGGTFEPIMWIGDSQTISALGAVHGTLALLQDVGEFVGEHSFARCAGGVVPALLEHDVRAGGEGVCLDRFGCLMRGGIGVGAHVGETRAESSFHLVARVVGKG